MIRLRKWIGAYAYLVGWLVTRHPELIADLEQLANADGVPSEVGRLAAASALEARLLLELPR